MAGSSRLIQRLHRLVQRVHLVVDGWIRRGAEFSGDESLPFTISETGAGSRDDPGSAETRPSEELVQIAPVARSFPPEQGQHHQVHVLHGIFDVAGCHNRIDDEHPTVFSS